jgi:hypothetical protein
MQICLFLDRSRVLRWHAWLADALSDRHDCDVSVAFARTTLPLPRALGLVLVVERLIYGLDQGTAVDRMDDAEFARDKRVDTAGKFDIVVDLAGYEQALPPCRRRLTPLFNSAPGEAGAMLAVLDRLELEIAISDSADPSGIVRARPGITDRRVMTTALDNILSCALELILKALDTPIRPAASPNGRGRPLENPPAPVAAAVLASVTRTLAWKAQKFLTMLVRGGDTWAVAWRIHSRESLFDVGECRFAVLPSDGRRYYADPFPYCHNGGRFVFVEEYEFAANRGCISVVSIGPDGTASTPRPIIEESHHLSFPYVFDCEGDIWMVPESGAAGRIDLYRARDFPYRWTREAVLLDGIAAYDPTLLLQNGQFWMLATVARWKTSTWDNLCVFQAERLGGPWRPHPMNPVLLDATQCRPGGALFRRGGQTYRLAQDCSQIYGGAVSVCRLDTLTRDGFRQTVMGRIETNLAGCHTYNRHSDLEVLDVFGSVHEIKHVTASYPSRQKRKHDASIADDALRLERAAEME